eukprot:51881-Eustigmatos_ZCMA.PRE.1
MDFVLFYRSCKSCARIYSVYRVCIWQSAFRLADGPSVVCLVDATSVLWWCNSEWVEHRLHPSPGPACLFSGRNQVRYAATRFGGPECW